MKYFLSGLILFVLFSVTTLAHAETKVYFSPNGGCQEAVITEINNAHKSIDIAMYAFASREIAHALVKAKQRKVEIRIVLDKAQIKDRFSKAKYLTSKGINVKFHMGPGLMNDRLAVIDDHVVLTGSFIWSILADKRNADNLLIITDKEIAQKYAKQFKHLWSQSGEGGFKEW